MDSEEEIAYSSDNEPSENTCALEQQWEVLSTPEKVLGYRNECIWAVTNNLDETPSAVIERLLNHFRWDVERLVENYYREGKDNFFTAAHIVYPFAKAALPATDVDYCPVCYESSPEMYGLECGHLICKICWTEYLTTKIMSDGMGSNISCAAFNCDILIDQTTVMSLLLDPTVQEMYQRLVIKNFVECNRFLRCCPSPDCNSVIRVLQRIVSCPVKCDCGHTFCFLCGNNWHDPARCDLLKKWIKTSDEELATSKWIAVNAKECPRCQTIIEKNGGCNHMTCRSIHCKAEFCWICLGPWNLELIGHTCIRYNENASKSNLDKHKKELDRHLFYYDRYMNHMQSLRMERELYVFVEEKVKKLKQTLKDNIFYTEGEFLKNAVDVLCQCRQTLMYTYVFAYYIKRNNQSDIFEDNQKGLESATEKLSGYLERDITLENLPEILRKVQNLYMDCDRRRQALTEHVSDGNDKGWWEYHV